MAAQPLRRFEFNPSEDARSMSALERGYCERNRVSVSTTDVLPLLLDAALANRAWIEDFAEDTIDIPQDMYEVLLAYRRYRSEAA